MPPELRLCLWSERDLTFWAQVEGVSVPVARVPFEVGPLGPYAALVGSPIRYQAIEQERAWVQRGELPDCAKPLDGESLARARARRQQRWN